MLIKEYRKLDDNIQLTESRKIEGYALVFNSLSNLIGGGFREKINPNALDGIIQKSDVFATLNHQKERGILARSKKGNGTLTLTIDEKGLKYEFEAPKTALGDETIEMLTRGDITASSFVFTIKNDKWDKQEDGTYIRTIENFDELYDVSPVFKPAYEDTTAETFKRFLEEEKREIEEKIQDVKNEDVVEEQVEEVVEIEEEVIEEQVEQVEEVVEQVEEIEEEKEEIIEEKINNKTDSENREINKTNIKQMEKIKLISIVNKVAEKRELSELEQEFLNAGAAEFRKSGNSIAGSIQLPMQYEYRSDITVGSNGGENVAEQKLSIVEPLRANSTLVAAGAQMLTNLVGDVSIPSYSGTNVLWKGETASATDGAGSFAEVILKPKRLTAYVAVSKQFLLQDSNDAEAMLQRDIMSAISEKLEQTVLGNAAKSETQPQGLFETVTGTTTATYAALTALESGLEDLNVKDYTFIVNPKAKATLKGTKINEGKMVYADNQIDGMNVYSTSSVYSKGVLVADFRDLIIGVWGIDITVDPYSLAGDGKVKLIVNAYVDAAFRRNSYKAINLA